MPKIFPFPSKCYLFRFKCGLLINTTVIVWNWSFTVVCHGLRDRCVVEWSCLIKIGAWLNRLIGLFILLQACYDFCFSIKKAWVDWIWVCVYHYSLGCLCCKVCSGFSLSMRVCMP